MTTTPPIDASKVWVVIPAYNEHEVLISVVETLRPYGYSVALVDDGSTIQVSSFLSSKKLGVHLLRHVNNLGQGAALQTGIDYALIQGAQYIVTFDSDGQHQASEISKLLQPLIEKRAEIALGTRFSGGGKALNISRGKVFILKLATWLSRTMTGLPITDTHNGFRAFTAPAAQRIRITQNKMSHASQILHEIASKRVSFTEVPVTIQYTDYSLKKGQKISNAFNILWESVTDRFGR